MSDKEIVKLMLQMDALDEVCAAPSPPPPGLVEFLLRMKSKYEDIANGTGTDNS